MRRISPALILSVVAIVVALTGTAIAGGYIITSTRQIKPNVRRALKGNRGPQGPQGGVGAAGVPGPAGPVNLAHMQRVEVAGTLAPGGIGHLAAICPAGSGAIHGDWSIVSDNGVPFYELTDATSYVVGVDNFNSTQSADVSAIVWCVPTGAAVAARAHHANFAALDQARRDSHSR